MKTSELRSKPVTTLPAGSQPLATRPEDRSPELRPPERPAVDPTKDVKTRGAIDLSKPGARKRIAAANIDAKLPEKSSAEHDYVIIGAGAGGAVTAARLAELGHKVLVLEGGDDRDVLESRIPAAHAVASEHPELKVDGTSYYVDHFTDAEKNQRDPKFDPAKGGILYPRGEGIGGSTRMNAMIFVRPDDVDWNRIAEATGDPSWKAENMRPYMNILEKNRFRPVLRLLHEIGKRIGVESMKNIGGHGFDGWLETTRADPRILLRDKQLLKMVWETTKFSFAELGSLGDKLKRIASVFDPNDDLAQGTEGLTLTPTSITKEGRRNGPRDRLLDVQKAHPDRIEIRTGAKVDRVLLDSKGDAVGVQYREAGGKSVRIGARREVVLSAGTYETPAILARSGIADEATLDALAPHGVPKKVVLPGVGRSLSDRYEYGLVFRLKEAVALTKDLPLTFDDDDAAFQEWKNDGTGPYATNGAVVAFQAKSDPSIDDPDLYFFLVPGKFEGYYDGYSKDSTADPNLCTLVILHENKQDRKGTVTVDPNDPSGHPKINFMYHGEEGGADDRLPIARGIQLGRKLIERFGDMVDSEVLPGAQHQTLDQIADEIGRGTWGHHANGTARMGREGDPMAVVDSKFQVFGTSSLRVVDASTFPDNVGSFIVSAVMLQAEKAAQDLDVAAKKADAAPTTAFKPHQLRR